MSALLFLARAFIRVFGITEPTPEQERRAAWFIGALCFGIVAAVVGAFFAFATMRR